MEGLGFYSAASANQNVRRLIVRGIADLAEAREEAISKGSQEIASQHAAEFTFDVLATLEKHTRTGLMTSSLIEQTIGNLIKTAGLPIVTDIPTRSVDFIIRDKNNNIIAIEVKGGLLKSSDLKKLANKISKKIGALVNRFILVTPNDPDEKSIRSFKNSFNDAPFSAEWVSVREFPNTIGLIGNFDITQPETIAELQLLAMDSKIHTYSRSIIGTQIQGLENKSTYQSGECVAQYVPNEYRSLTRQFSYSVIAKIISIEVPLTDSLLIGRRCLNAVIVLSDLKNFSYFVKAAKPDDLNDLMRRYYRESRELVWKHNGTLDKFIGDAVLAVFGYPIQDELAEVHALKYAAGIIDLGRSLIPELQDKIDEFIPSGTRIGIACGDVSVLDIGQDQIELTFVGDTINLAARLEKECEVDGILLSNIVKVRGSKSASQYFADLAAIERDFEPDKVKGQRGVIRAWQVSPTSVAKLNSHHN